MSRVAIAGAGVAGRLIAWQLARLGHEVDVFDPAPNGAVPERSDRPSTQRLPADASYAAGFTAAGMLSPLAELENAPPEVAARGWRSLDLWPTIMSALATADPTPALFRREGSLLVAHPRDTGSAARVLARLQAALAPQQPPNPGFTRFAPQPLAPEALQALEPALARGLHGWLLPGEGQLDAPRVLAALASDATAVRWHWQTSVAQVTPHTVQLATGVLMHVDVAVDTRGLGARPSLPLRGVRGELLWLHAPGVALHRPVRCMHPRHRVYLVPRCDDVVIVGATEIESEDRSCVSVRSAVELLSAAHSIVAELAEARIVRLETNLRPATADQRPYVHCEDGLIRINGLFRHGWLLAPALVEEALQRSGLAPAIAPPRVEQALEKAHHA